MKNICGILTYEKGKRMSCYSVKRFITFQRIISPRLAGKRNYCTLYVYFTLYKYNSLNQIKYKQILNSSRRNFIQITAFSIYRVIHKGWDFKDDCTKFILSGDVDAMWFLPSSALNVKMIPATFNSFFFFCQIIK